LQKRASGDHVWIFRWRDRNAVHRGEIFGTISQLRNLSQARAEAERLRLREKHLGVDNAEKNGTITFGQLVERYKKEQMPDRYSTRHCYTSWLDVHILPRWGYSSIESVADPLNVEQWLSELDLAPKSKGHVRCLMNVLFTFAMKWRLFPIGRNPMELVAIKGGIKRRLKPAILSQRQVALLLTNIPEDHVRLFVILSMCLGLRLSEVLGLQWGDIDWKELQISVRRGVVQGRLGEVKTEYSEAQVPLDRDLARLLHRWKLNAEFAAPSDWIFASPFAEGKSPYFPTSVRRKIHAGALRAGLSHLLKGEPTKIFRHSYRSWLGASNTPIAIIKDLMRHADIRTTMNEYGNVMPEPMRSANSMVVQMALRSRRAI
jgi:integrase